MTHVIIISLHQIRDRVCHNGRIRIMYFNVSYHLYIHSGASNLSLGKLELES